MKESGYPSSDSAWRLFMAVVTLMLASGFAWSADPDISINLASWRADRGQLDVSGTALNPQTVTVVNAYAPNQSLGSSRVRSESWSVRARRVSPVPCRVRATPPGAEPVIILSARGLISFGPPAYVTGQNPSRTPPLRGLRTAGPSLGRAPPGRNLTGGVGGMPCYGRK